MEAAGVEAPPPGGKPQTVLSEKGAPVDADAVVLATSVEPLKQLVARSPALRDVAWRERVESAAGAILPPAASSSY